MPESTKQTRNSEEEECEELGLPNALSAERIANAIRAYELDDPSIARRREKAIREAGLDDASVARQRIAVRERLRRHHFSTTPPLKK